MKFFLLVLTALMTTSCTLLMPEPADGDDCGTSQFTFTSSCEETQRRFYERRSIDDKYFYCAHDEDCEMYSPVFHCESGTSIEICPQAVASATLPEYESKLQAIIDEICSCHYGSCHISLCAMRSPKCVDQRCIGMMDQPDAGQEDTE